MILNSDHVFIIAEAGSNWRLGTPERDFEMAKSLIDVASNSGADAIKFQTYRSKTVYVPNAGTVDYLVKKGITQSITKIFDDLAMPYDMIPKLANYCKSRNIEFMSTPFSIDDAKVIDPYVNVHKLASSEITHSRLIEFLAKTRKPVIFSTGAADVDDIQWAIKHFRKHGGEQIILLQTTMQYPAPLKNLNLLTIFDLKNVFNVSVGFSDHSIEPLIGPIIATAFGATVIEKHFTLNKKLPGPDNSFALEPNDLKNMVYAIRNSEKCLGHNKKIILNDENYYRDFSQRSIQCIDEIKKGDIFCEGQNIDILRSGSQRKGLHPKFLDSIEGKLSLRNIPIGDGILIDDYENK
jgi:N-acetylneuraminate synthase